MAEQIEEQIDCRACANCCKVAETDITERDVDRLSCKLFPHLVRGAGSIESRMWRMIDWASTGPSISSIPLSPN